MIRETWNKKEKKKSEYIHKLIYWVSQRPNSPYLGQLSNNVNIKAIRKCLSIFCCNS